MADLLLFHHGQGLTAGCVSLALRLGAAGHRVHTPDLYEGRTFGDIAEGVRHAEEIGFETIIERGVAAAESLPEEIVYVGLSLGALPAQKLVQTRARAKGALLLHAFVPPSEFGPWPRGIPVQIHMMEDDEWVEEDLVPARALAETVEEAELFLYPGDRHLFTDDSLPDYDEEAARLVEQRMFAFLDRVG